jgi:hypothetical protein
MCAEESAAETYNQLAREILADLVSVNMGVTTRSTAPAPELLVSRFIAAGFDKSDVSVWGKAQELPT